MCVLTNLTLVTIFTIYTYFKSLYLYGLNLYNIVANTSKDRDVATEIG